MHILIETNSLEKKNNENTLRADKDDVIGNYVSHDLLVSSSVNYQVQTCSICPNLTHLLRNSGMSLRWVFPNNDR